MNKFSFRDIYSQGEHVYPWKVEFDDGAILEGSCMSVRGCYREAKRRVKIHRKMEKFLNPKSKLQSPRDLV